MLSFRIHNPAVLTLFAVAALAAPPQAAAGCVAPAGFTKAWIGDNGNTWSSASSWAPAGVPASGDSVYICSSAATQPVLTANASITNLLIDSGASLDVGSFTLTASGNVDAALISGSGTLTMSGGSSRTLRGNVPNLRIPSSGVIVLNGPTNASGNLVLAAGDLTLGGFMLKVAGNFVSQNLGDKLVMNNAEDILDVAGNVSFTGGGETGLLTAGELRVGGDFTETNACCTGTAFRPSGSHKTVFDGSRMQTITFNTGSPNGFHHVEIVGSGTAVVTSAKPDVLVNGNLLDSVGGRWQAANTTFRAATLSLPPSIKTNAIFPGNTTLTLGTVIDGDMTVSGALYMGGQTVRVKGNFTTQSLSDTFYMNNPADRLIVDGDVAFRGGGGLNLMTAGEIRIKGNFTEANACCTGEAFRPTGTHLVVFEGANSTISFDTGGNNAFNHLAVEGGVTLATRVNANGKLMSSRGSTSSVTGTGQQLNVKGLDVATLTIDNVLLASTGGGIALVEDLVFRNHAATAVQFSVTHPGGDYLFTRTQFLSTPSTGNYIRATDSATGDGLPLLIKMFDSTPADGTAHESENGGAVINWIANSAPVVTNDSYTTNEDVRLEVAAAQGVLANDSDPEAAGLTATLVAPPSSGRLTLRSDGSFTFNPTLNFAGPVTFDYAATDPEGASTTARARINVTEVNDAPVARDDAYAMPANGRLTIAAPGVLANDHDAEEDQLTASIVDKPAHGTATVEASGALTYAPAADYVGPDSFTYSVNDGSSTSHAATVQITVTDAPPRAAIRANPESIRRGESSTLLWATENASSVSIEPGLGDVPPTGARSVSPQVTTTYTLTARSKSSVVTRSVTVQVENRAGVVLVSRPRPILQRADTAGGSARFALVNLGGADAQVTLTTSAQFFTVTPATFTLAAGGKQAVTITTVAMPAGHHEGSVAVAVDGAHSFVVPVHLLSVNEAAAAAKIVATAHRTQLKGAQFGAVTFVNQGTSAVRGVITSDVPWLTPRTKLVDLAAGASETVLFDIDRTRRPAKAHASGAINLTYLAAQPAGIAASSNGTGGTTQTTSVLVRDVVTPVVTTTSIPPLDPTQITHYMPGMIRTSSTVSDLTVTNRSSSAVPDVSIFFTASSSSPFTSLLMQIPQLSANSATLLPDAIKTGFGSSAESGTIQIRGDSSLQVAAEVTNVANPAGTLGTALLPLRGDRAAASGESLYLAGVERSDSTRTDLYLQETQGSAASGELSFLNEQGVVISTSTLVVDAFGALERRDVVPTGAVAARIRNTSSGAARITARALVTDTVSGDISEIIDWNRNFALGASDPQLVLWAASASSSVSTDLVMTNRGATAAEGRLIFTRAAGGRKRPVRQAATSAGREIAPMEEATISVAPGQTLVVRDVLRELFGASSASGSLIYAPLTGELTITAAMKRTAAEGSEAVTIAPVLKQDIAMQTGSAKRFGGVEDSPVSAIAERRPGTFQNSLGMIETSNQAVTVRLRMYYTHVPANSTVAVRASATRDYSLRAGSVMMIDNISAALLGDDRETFGELHDTDIDVEVIDGSGAVVPFLVSTDNGSGDARIRID